MRLYFFKCLLSVLSLILSLSTLLLHSNLLSSLPYPLNELHKLTTLVVAFNRSVLLYVLPVAARLLLLAMQHIAAALVLRYSLHNKLCQFFFFRFKMVPHIVKELQSLRILIIAGNKIT